MIQGVTRILELPGSKGGITLRLTVQEQYDVQRNCSDIALDLALQSSQYYNYIYYLDGTLEAEGRQVVEMDSATPTHYAKAPALNTYTPVQKWSDAYLDPPWVLTGIPHSQDGSKTLTLRIALRGYTSGGGGSGWRVETELAVPLTHIPRATTVTATDAVIGGVSMIALARRSEDYSHTLHWAFGSLSGWLDETGAMTDQAVRFTASSLGFALPESFYYEIPQSPQGSCTLTCCTWQGDTPIGEAQQTVFRVTADPALCGPTVSGTVREKFSDLFDITGSSERLIAHVSNALCTISAQACLGAQIVEKTIDGVAVTGDSRTISGFSGSSVTFAVRDSRGFAARYTLPVETVDYIPLTAHMTARRTDPTGGQVEVTVRGSCFRGTFGSRQNSIHLLLRAGDRDITLTAEGTGDTYTARCLVSGLDYRRSHTLTLTARDLVGACTAQTQVGVGIPVFHWGEHDFVFHVPVTAPGINGVRQLPLAGWPVGAVLLTDGTMDPTRTLGGAWEQRGTVGEFFAYVRQEDPADSSALLGVGVLGKLILGKE